ncbi:aspartate-semialdehyde dehydrogenase [Ignicoccus hospitalis]|uniref:Aspartate semialdehyde dehydrogenase n=1 Tax=Ignicoccus hospitalis (strain KIN4/I / DSM 18386 / JCM 14125) TaxID=453591 RepID=A8AAI2_IGNH4|nr:aspartate-semialdehyde dehydrogenase [Ignicoccus hospitalis]ABU81934.1 aspartate semialdehyde dehydrogenase [Ignicoccus hospitalis KIN4/I]HIH89907.1 aspartate-semialdehyde dehydrogenase [Desulfurococcaceae archaeon]
MPLKTRGKDVDKLKVAVLGATGMAGQWFASLLEDHPYFELVALGASKRSAGKKYKEAVRWVIPRPFPTKFSDYVVFDASDPDALPEKVDLVFSALPSEVAGEIELKYLKKGFNVVSNASPFRLEPDVPLMNPEINWDHLELLKKQERWGGKLVKNPNCTTAVLTLPLKPIMDEFGIKEITVTTLQAISGAGFAGLTAYSIVDNVIPYIAKEEYKVKVESKKMLGKLEGDSIRPADFVVEATTTRVPVLDGHTEVVYITTKRSVDVEQVKDVLKSFESEPQRLGLPTAPPKPVIVMEQEDRPQPRLDRMNGNGMAVTVGRIEITETNRVRMVMVGHNLLRGASGVSLLTAELMYKKGYIT